MSNRQESEVRTIHPRALRELGEEACIVALGVARDLRSGAIPPAEYDQRSLFGAARCIAAHIARRMKRYRLWFYFSKPQSLACGYGLFGVRHPSDPQLASDAIERYIYDGSETPWSA